MKYIAWVVLLLIFPSVIMAETLEFVFSDFPPFEYLEDGSAAGMNKEILEEACKRLHITPVFRQLPWKRALEYVKHGDSDAIFSLFKNDERLKYYNYPDENINTVKMVIITTKKSDINVTTLEDLRGKIVGVYLGSSYGKKFDTSDWIIKEAVTSNEELLKKQAVGRTDVIVMDERVAKYWCKKLDMEDKFKTLAYVITTNPTYVAFSKKRRELTKKDFARRFSVVLKEMKNDGFIETLEKKYAFNISGNMK